MDRALKFALVAAGFSLLVGAVGGWIAGPEHRQVVWLGVGLAYAIQVVFFVGFFVVAFASQPLLAHGLGMLGRLMIVGSVALFWVPWAGVPAAPFLFSLVAALFVTTLVEPLFLVRIPSAR